MNDWMGNIRMILPAKMKIPEVRVETSGQAFKLDFSRREVSVQALYLSSLKSASLGSCIVLFVNN